MKARYKISLNDYSDFELEAVWEIDFEFKYFSEWLKNKGIKTVQDAIIEMNVFWSGSPNKEDNFNEHLDYFLKNATTVLANFNDSDWRSEEYLENKLFSDTEGFAIGECGIKLVKFKKDLFVRDEMLEVEVID
ncbi:Uncharacterised protein [Gallibacterium anatis]|uniref:DUF2528 domain-containing protein n=1 Tax=Gallibacterium anatis TaxID=750 RepID=A0A377H551_9PAST|nr:hypothetical protein [Gallibacterium anatis]KGQ55329.1 hypothetical protein IE01_08500 [Gallibacterium anatis DSM 16844 = F 149]STO37631.1 Uncharacterised protein [Gallibacterium anatis]STO61174.1 Uncharacterised protein [Gallibacterium anatis]